jgi:hypothetical protein
MFEEARSNLEKTTRRGMALYFGTINLAGETVTNPTKILRGIERRGERVLKQIEANNKQVRRNVTLLQKRTNETARSVRGTAKATVGLAASVANDVEAAAPSRPRSTRKRSTSRKRTTARSRVAAAGSTATRRSSTTRSGSRSQAARKAARTRAANASKSTLEKAQDRVQHGFQQVGHSLENVGERIERTVEQVAS